MSKNFPGPCSVGCVLRDLVSLALLFPLGAQRLSKGRKAQARGHIVGPGGGCAVETTPH